MAPQLGCPQRGPKLSLRPKRARHDRSRAHIGREPRLGRARCALKLSVPYVVQVSDKRLESVPIRFRREHDIELADLFLDVPGAPATTRHHEAVAGLEGLDAALVIDDVDMAL